MPKPPHVLHSGVTTGDLSRALGISIETVCRRINDGSLSATKGPGKKPRNYIVLKSLKKFLEAQGLDVNDIFSKLGRCVPAD